MGSSLGLTKKSELFGEQAVAHFFAHFFLVGFFVSLPTIYFLEKAHKILGELFL
jgi:hypothetical protein